MKRGKSGVAIAVILVAAMLLTFAFAACDHESDSNYYTATFVADGETVDEIEFTVEDEALTEPTVPSKVGYIGEWQEYDIVAEDITVEAVYTAIVYGVDYVLDGGVNAAGNPSSYTVLTLGGADGSIALAEPSKKGEMGYTSNGDGSIEVTQNVYTFLGWYKDASFEQEVDSLTLDLCDVTLYAKWSEPTSQTETVQVYTREGD